MLKKHKRTKLIPKQQKVWKILSYLQKQWLNVSWLKLFFGSEQLTCQRKKKNSLWLHEAAAKDA